MNKLEKKPLSISIILIIVQTILYKLSVYISGTPTLIGNSIDTKIPFNIYFIIPYFIWYIFLLFVPYYIYKKDKDNFIKYISNIILLIIIANVIYLVFPTTVIRPEVNGNGILYGIIKLLYFVDTPIKNCFPSMHCAFSLTFILGVITTKNSNKLIDTLVIITSLLIMASTLLIKQHVFIDVISGLITSLLVFIIVRSTNKIDNLTKKIIKED